MRNLLNYFMKIMCHQYEIQTKSSTTTTENENLPTNKLLPLEAITYYTANYTLIILFELKARVYLLLTDV